MLLEEKVAIVTGAARGTGAEIARQFVKEGAAVLVADVRVDEGEALANDLGPRAVFRRLDVTDEDGWAALVEEVVRLQGRVDVLVNNAAVLHIGSIERTSLDDFRRLFEVNTLGTYAGIRAVSAPMKEAGKGSIVNISSIDGLHGLNGVIAYCASKWAVRGVAKAAALELGRYGIRVNTVCPSSGNPEMFAPWGEELAELGDSVEHYIANRGLPREGELEEIAKAVVWLASDHSSYCTGIDLPVDGGDSAGTYLDGFGG